LILAIFLLYLSLNTKNKYMKIIKSITAYFFLIIASLSCSSEQATTNDISELNLTNVSYGTDSYQKYDLYLPANRNSSTKTLILIHGGSWIGGDKTDMNVFGQILKTNFPNYAICNINYRLANAQSTAFPKQLDDIETVISSLKTSNYSISNQYALIGVSAGGHLSMLYSYTKNTNNEIKMVCSIVGPTNFSDPAYTDNPSFTSTFLAVAGTTYQENPSYFLSLSPLFTATNSAPPTILFYGNNDPLVPINQGPDMFAKLNDLNVNTELNVYNGGHLNDWSFNDITDLNNKLTNFIHAKF
jgi:acetyl esterase/lipase